jgi:hypothetical protein
MHAAAAVTAVAADCRAVWPAAVRASDYVQALLKYDLAVVLL